MHLYRRLAPFYFALEEPSRNFPLEVELLLDLFPFENPLIDLGCGTGEHVGRLRREGREVFGVDGSPEMVRVARERYGSHLFEAVDLRNLRRGRRFGGAFSLFGVFNYLTDDSSLRLALRNCASLLDPGSLFLVEVWSLSPLRLLPFRSLHPVARVESEGHSLERMRGHRLLGPGPPHLVEVSYRYRIGKGESPGEERLDDLHTVRVFDEGEMEGFLEEAGFRTDARFGSWEELFSGRSEGGEGAKGVFSATERRQRAKEGASGRRLILSVRGGSDSLS